MKKLKKRSVEIVLDGIEYKVEINYKLTRILKLRFINDKFIVSSPFYVKENAIKEFILKNGTSLIKKVKFNLPSGDNFIYLFGEKISLSFPGCIKFSNGEEISFLNKEELNKKLLTFFKKVMENRTSFYENIMKIKDKYKIKVKNMNTRYGSNSMKTHTICYNFILIHYSFEIIDAVIVHELAHHFYRGHDKKFYDCVKMYYKDYDIYHTKLRKRIYK